MKKAGLFLVGALFLQACAAKVPMMTPEAKVETLRDIKMGNTTLDCDFACSASWRLRGRDEAKRLYEAHEWERLGLHVAEIGYQSDLSYFYLARAAEGMGAKMAALKYYRIANALASGHENGNRCADSDSCDGFAFPRDINPHLSALSPKASNKHLPKPETKTEPTKSFPTPESKPEPKPAAPASKSTAPAEQTAPKPPEKPAPSPGSQWVLPPPVAE